MPNYVDALGDAVRGAIRAFHGSPYDFDRFDASKIGTGEGSQAYAHGLYFAGKEGTGEYYKNMRPGELTLAEEHELNYSLKRMRELTGLLAGRMPDPQVLAMKNEWSQLQGRRNFLEDRPGRMYEVEIAHPENSLLDWDATLAQQGKSVREGLRPFRNDKYDLTPLDGTDIETGATALHRIAQGAGGGMADASEELRRAGIPGIRFLDRFSRATGNGTRNYVMFPGTEDSIRILRKYGIGGAAAGAAMSDEEQY